MRNDSSSWTIFEQALPRWHVRAEAVEQTLSGKFPNPLRSHNGYACVGCWLFCAVVPQGFSLAVKLGLTKQQVDSLVGIHPTAAEEVVGLKGPDRIVGPPHSGTS